MKRARMAVLGIAIAVAAAACGGAAAGSGGASSTAASAKSATVSVRSVPGVGSVLTDSQGRTLYSPAQEANGKILCTGACTSIWIPLTLAGNGAPTAAAGVSGSVGSLARPDGITQVTFDGAPLYTFFQDTAPGQVNGNGQQDSFGGMSFTWHAETASGAAAGMAGTGSTGSGYAGTGPGY